MWDSPTFCARCCRSFNRAVDKEKHVEYSGRHYMCYMCSHRPDFLTFRQLQQHESAKHVWCGWCSIYLRDEDALEDHDEDVHFFCDWCSEWFRNKYDWDEHNDQDHYRCTICGLVLENANNRRMHLRAHAPRNKQCPGNDCYRLFESFSAILIHLESGTCPCQADLEEIDQLAHQCYQARHYTNTYGFYKYRCPNCDRDFQLPSALFQHAETAPMCGGVLNPGHYLDKLQHWIEINV